MRIIILILIVGFLLPSYTMAESLNIEHDTEIIDIIHKEDFVEPIFNYPFIKADRINHLLKKLENKVYKAPINASINSQGKIVPEQTGITLHKTDTLELLYAFLIEGKHSSIDIPVRITYPKVDSEILSRIREKRIGSYVTYYKASNLERSNNILLASDAINNHVVFPNELFSFNEVVGKRTENKGYMKAPVIVKGELSEDIGGGICQVSSTLYNAVDSAGVHIVERFSHSRIVTYVPKGRDATVSWYGPDFKFKNKYNQPILIRAKAQEGKLYIEIYSSEDVEYTPHKIQRASDETPEEIHIDTNVSE